MSDTLPVEMDTPPFASTTSTVVSFTNDQLVSIALDSLAKYGHDNIDLSQVKSEFHAKTGLTLTVTTEVGKKPTKKKTRGPNKTKAKAKVEKEIIAAATDTDKVVTKTEEESGQTPFSPTTSNEETIATVKAEADVPIQAAFSTETTDIAPTTEIPPAFDFDALGNE